MLRHIQCCHAWIVAKLKAGQMFAKFNPFHVKEFFKAITHKQMVQSLGHGSANNTRMLTLSPLTQPILYLNQLPNSSMKLQSRKIWSWMNSWSSKLGHSPPFRISSTNPLLPTVPVPTNTHAISNVLTANIPTPIPYQKMLGITCEHCHSPCQLKICDRMQHQPLDLTMHGDNR